jgi:hypothetical protein
VRFRAAECGDLNELVLGAFDLEERAAAPDWNRKLNIATLAPITITSIKREAHLAVVETAALSRNLVRSPHFPLPSLAARECAISTALDEAQLQPANQGYKSRAAQTEDGPGAKGSAAKNEYQDSGGNRPVNFQALSLNEKDPVAANSIYGIFDENVEENVVESHISKLRKKLRRNLGYDPVNSVRYLGYRLEEPIRSH